MKTSLDDTSLSTFLNTPQSTPQQLVGFNYTTFLGDTIRQLPTLQQQQQHNCIQQSSKLNDYYAWQHAADIDHTCNKLKIVIR